MTRQEYKNLLSWWRYYTAILHVIGYPCLGCHFPRIWQISELVSVASHRFASFVITCASVILSLRIRLQSNKGDGLPVCKFAVQFETVHWYY